MGFFKKLVRETKEKAEQLERENTQRSGGGLSSLFGNLQKKKPIAVRGPRYDNVRDFLGERGSGKRPLRSLISPKIVDSRPAPTGIEALINPMRTDPGNQEDLRKLMDMQRQTFRSFLAPPPEVQQQAFPVTGQDLGLPMGPGTPAPGGVIFEGEVGGTPINIQDIIDNLPTGIGVGGIGSIPVPPNIPYEIPQITVPVTDMPPVDLPIDFNTYERVPDINIQMTNPLDSVPVSLPFQLPSVPQVPVMPLAPQMPMMPSFDVAPMPAMRLPRVRPDTKGLIDR